MTNPTISWYEKNAERLSAEYDKSDMGPLHGLLRRWIPCRGNVLEIGCGSGRDAFFLASLGCFVVALDGSDAMLRVAQKRLGEEKIENILFQFALFPLPNEHPLLACKFDAITAIAVLMHIPDNELYSFACQVKALLKEKGIFLCSFSSGERTSIDERFFKNREPQEIQRLFEEAGLSILSRAESKDGLGRDIIWTTLVFSSKLMFLLTE